MPKWGGTWRDVDDLARLAAAAARERDGDANYARAYWNLLQRQGTPNKNIFQDTEVSWQLMKKGFEDLVARYPHSAWVVNAFAGFSCLAGDKSTFREIWPRIGAYLDHRAWPEKAQPEACVKKLIGSPS